MKKMVIKMFLCGMILTMLVTGCKSSDVTVSQDSSLRFQPTGNEYNVNGEIWSEYVDTRYGNLYITRNGQYSSGFSPLYDENGKIVKYNASQSIDTQGVVN